MGVEVVKSCGIAYLTFWFSLQATGKLTVASLTPIDTSSGENMQNIFKCGVL